MKRLAVMLLLLFALASVARGQLQRERAAIVPKLEASDQDTAYAIRWWHEWRRRGRIRGRVIWKLRARLREREASTARRRTSVSRSQSHAGRFLATCYDLTGRTATGRQAGPGVIAVDPAVIPLGSSVSVSDYGSAVAADTGGAIKGYRIDEWRASCAGYPNPMVTVRW